MSLTDKSLKNCKRLRYVKNCSAILSFTIYEHIHLYESFFLQQIEKININFLWVQINSLLEIFPGGCLIYVASLNKYFTQYCLYPRITIIGIHWGKGFVSYLWTRIFIVELLWNKTKFTKVQTEGIFFPPPCLISLLRKLPHIYFLPI